MYPILFQYKFISIGGYGLMLGLGFYLSFLLTEREFQLKNIDLDLAYKILIALIPASLIGSKIFHILEHLDEFFIDPKGMIFSGAGLSAYGGFVLGSIVAYYIIKKNNESFLNLADAATPGMALGYCFGRFGCHVAGDGCYGVATSSLFGTAYPNGIVPTSNLVLPTPLFEVFVSFIFVGLFLRLRKKEWPAGRLLFLYMILNGLARFLVEFVRRNPQWLGSFSQAQVIGILLVILGAIGLYYTNKRPILAG